MSKITEYIEAAVGLDASGLPASSSQLTIGLVPFSIAENEDIDEVTQVTAACTTDAIVDIEILDSIVKLTFDFSNEPEILAQFMEELETYLDQKKHVIDATNDIMEKLHVAEKNNDESEVESLFLQLKATSIPFLLPSIMPVVFGGSVQVGFQDDPKFVFVSSDRLNEYPSKLVMIFDAMDLFCQDEMGIYENDFEEEIEAQREELWYMEEAKRIEEENYRAQWGYNDSDYYDDDGGTDNRMKGVRIK